VKNEEYLIRTRPVTALPSAQRVCERERKCVSECACVGGWGGWLSRCADCEADQQQSGSLSDIARIPSRQAVASPASRTRVLFTCIT